jgi:hypothetical protein
VTLTLSLLGVLIFLAYGKAEGWAVRLMRRRAVA